MYAGAAFLAWIGVAGCNNEVQQEQVNGKQAFALTATVDADTRTTVEGYSVLWSEGDKILVYGDNNARGVLELQASDAGKRTGTFGGALDGAADDLKYALYPAPAASNSTDIELPETYTYPYQSNSPMYAVFGADKSAISFNHLCGMLRVEILGIATAGEKTLTLSGSNIAGTATVTEASTGQLSLAISSGKNSITITIPDGQNGPVFDIPLPAGTYTDGISLALKEGDTEKVARRTTENFEIKKGYITEMPTFTYFSTDATTAPDLQVPEVIEATNFAEATLNDATKHYLVEGEGKDETTITLTDVKSVVAKSVAFSGVTLSSPKTLSIKAEQVTLENMALTGEQPKANGNAQLSINGAKQVTINGFDATKTGGYNVLEIGLNSTGEELPAEVNINNFNVPEESSISNNAILIFGTQDNAVVNLTNCHFNAVSNCLRISNKSNATGVKVNIKDCTCTQWENRTGYEEYKGFLILEDYTSKTETEAQTNNLFGPDKLTVTFDNVIGPNGKIDFTADPSQGAPFAAEADKNTKQTYYICLDNVAPYVVAWDATKYPTFIFK